MQEYAVVGVGEKKHTFPHHTHTVRNSDFSPHTHCKMHSDFSTHTHTVRNTVILAHTHTVRNSDFITHTHTHAVVRQISMLFTDNKDSVFCNSRDY